MKHYIRTKDGKIIDTTKFENVYYNELGYLILESEDTNYCIDDDKIVKQANTIEELIEVGDLYFYSIKLTDRKVENQFDILGLTFDKDIMLAKLKAGQIELTELYTKQGNNYILVARKENGEWRVI